MKNDFVESVEALKDALLKAVAPICAPIIEWLSKVLNRRNK